MVMARLWTRMQIWLFSTQCSALQSRRTRFYCKSPAVVAIALNIELVIWKANSYMRSSLMQAAKCVSELVTFSNWKGKRVQTPIFIISNWLILKSLCNTPVSIYSVLRCLIQQKSVPGIQQIAYTSTQAFLRSLFLG